MAHRGLEPAVTDDAMLWLALLPYWTGEAAERAAFPLPGPAESPFRQRLRDFVARTEREQGVQRSGALRAERMATVEFWCPPAVRAAELAAAMTSPGRPAVVTAARLIAERLSGADLDLPLAPVVEHWIAIVQAGEQDRPDLTFLAEVRSLCRADKRTAAAELITAAETAEPVAAVALRTAIDAARRMLHLANRRNDDTKAMREFQPRPEWTAALLELLRHRPGHGWALHLVGPGGTGKTSFIRYVAAGDLARQNGLTRIAAARVDFDYLSPAYPAHSPAQLLIELADELAAEVDNAASEEALMACYAAARSANTAGGPMAEAVRCFAALITALARPVLLMLDTCEELSRADPGDTPDAAVDMMFDLLGAVHAAVPGVRVLLSGRRRLRPGTPEWHDLIVLPARGFRRIEALRFLTRPDNGARMSPELVDLVLRMSPERGDPDPAEPRFSPYDLALYRQWWAAEKTITAGQLRASGKLAYIEARIVKRLGPRLLTCLPAVALLGRFDESTLAPALPPGANAGATIAELARQDWTDTDTEPESGSLIVTVDEDLRRALLEWCLERENTRLRQAREVLVVDLAEQIRTRDLDGISTAQVVCALRLARPIGAVLLWEQLEARMADGDDWRWIARVCPRVLGVSTEPTDAIPGDGVTGNALLSAAIRATELAVALRTGRTVDRAAVWADIETGLTGLPDAVAGRLLLRARLGRLAAGDVPTGMDRVTALLQQATEHPNELGGSVAAAVETLAERLPDGLDLTGFVAVVREWQTITADPAVDAALRISLARLDPRRFALRTTDEQAVRRTAEYPVRWADWLAPPSATVRLHLVQARHAHDTGRPLLSLPLPTWESAGLAHPGSVDADRLLSQCLTLRLGHGMVSADHLERMWAHGEQPLRDPAHLRLHQRIRPLFVSVSQGFLALGDTVRARGVLEQRLAGTRLARTVGWETEAAAARAALIGLARRLRDRAPMAAVAGEGPEDQAWIAAALIDGELPPREGPGSGGSAWRWHQRWQATSVDPGRGRAFVPETPDLTGISGDFRLAELLGADAAEAAVVGGGPGTAPLSAWAGTRGRPPAPSGDDVLSALEPLLATARPEEFADLDRGVLGRLPPLYVASAALEIGEQRALRDPRGARPLLELAARLAETRSPVLALQAVTLGALALVHAGERPAGAVAKAAVLGVNSAYERLRDQRPAGLPEWGSLMESESAPPEPWAGWLSRIRVAVAGLARERDLPAASVAHRPAGSVELYPAAFGDREPPALTAPRPAARPAIGKAGWRISLALFKTGVRAAQNPRITFRIMPGSRQMTIALDSVPTDWMEGAGGPADGSIRRLLAPRVAGSVELGSDDEVPELPAVMRDAFRVEGKARLVTRLQVNASDQLRFWETEIMERLGAGPGETTAGWYRAWTRAGEPPRPHGPERVVRLIGAPVRTRAVFEATYPEPGRRTPEDVAALGADLVVVQGPPTAEWTRGEPVRPVDALRFAVRCMDAGTRNLLLVPQPTVAAETWLAARGAGLNRSGRAPRPLALVDLVRDLRREFATVASHAVLFLREGEEK